MSKTSKTGLEDAYAVRTPDDNRRLYRDWAKSYDEEFAAAHGYVYPEELTALFLGEIAESDAAPVLDVGCGTGLVGVALRARMADAEIDGIDISPEMLAAAKSTGVYRDLIEADLTEAASPATPGVYGGVISAGAFTHGHVGPDALDALLETARPGAVFALGINEDAFREQGFAAKFEALEGAGAIDGFRVETGRVYAPSAGHDHAETKFQAAILCRS